MSEMITFGAPLWFPVGAVVMGLLLLFYRKMAVNRQLALQKIAASHLLGKLCRNVSLRRRMVKKTLVLIAIGCCFLALARPQYGFKWIEVKRKGIDILFAVDTSRSMLAEDVLPNRLKRAKFAILDFVGQLEGDRVGLMPFAGTAFLMCPMTIDYSAFENSLEAIDTEIIPKGGTDIAVAIKEAEAILSNEANHKILILITDGENLQGDALQAAKDAAERGMTIYTVGVGTSEGELVPINRGGKSGFVKDEAGNFITSQLDEKTLTEIARATGGLYVPLGRSGEGLETIYQKKLSLVPKEDLAEKRHKVALERFSWPLGLAILLLMIEFVVSGRKSSRSIRIPFIKTAGRRKRRQVASGILLLSILFSGVDNVRASEGEDAYAAGDYISASEFYDEQLSSHPNDPMLYYNYGTAAYKNNMFEDAAKAFSEALKSTDLQLQEKAYYNRGNALYQRGSETLQTDPQHTMDMWGKAVDSFDGALQLNSMNDDARYNFELVKQKLEELQKQQDKQDQQQEKQQEQQDQQQKKADKCDQQKNQDPGDEQGSGQDDQADQSAGEDSKQQSGKESSQGQEQNDEQSAQDNSASDGGDNGQERQDAGATTAEEGIGKDSADAAVSEAQQAEARDEARRLMGKMTAAEARELLNSLQDEEGELNFVPSRGIRGTKEQKILKDW